MIKNHIQDIFINISKTRQKKIFLLFCLIATSITANAQVENTADVLNPQANERAISEPVQSSTPESSTDSTSVSTSALDQIAENLNINTELLDETRLKMKAELILKESILLSMEKMDAFNQATGFKSPYGHVVAIPNVIVSLYILSKGIPVSNKVVNYLTPDNQIKEFTKKVKAVDLKISEAKKTLTASKNALISKMDASMDVIQLAKDDVLIKQNALDAIVGQKYNLLQTKPGALYRLGRMTRGVVKTTVVMGSIAITVGMLSDLVILWLPDDKAAFELQLKSDVQDLEILLNSDVRVP